MYLVSWSRLRTEQMRRVKANALAAVCLLSFGAICALAVNTALLAVSHAYGQAYPCEILPQPQAGKPAKVLGERQPLPAGFPRIWNLRRGPVPPPPIGYKWVNLYCTHNGRWAPNLMADEGGRPRQTVYVLAPVEQRLVEKPPAK